MGQLRWNILAKLMRDDLPIYASTFISGVQDYVKTLLEQSLPNVTTLLVLDGLIVYRTDVPTGSIKKLRFLNNSFIVLRMFKTFSGKDPLHEMVTAIVNDTSIRSVISTHLDPGERGKSFRIIASHENQLVSLESHLRNAIEKKLSGINHLRVNRSKPQIEFWFLYRNEGYGFFLKRMTHHTAYEKILQKGELRPELSHLLCMLSEPEKDDIVLDPFCGFGSIPLERASSFPYNMIFAVDKDPDNVHFVKRKAKKLSRKQPLIVKCQDALDLHVFEDNFIHKIVTDPPWGFFEDVNMDMTHFYVLMLQEFCRILRREGIIVILTASKEEFTHALSTIEGKLSLIDTYNILVSGKKAAMYKIIKTA